MGTCISLWKRSCQWLWCQGRHWRLKSLCSPVAMKRFSAPRGNLQIFLSQGSWEFSLFQCTEVGKTAPSLSCHQPNFRLTQLLLLMDFLAVCRTMIYVQQVFLLCGNYFHFHRWQFYNNLIGKHEEESLWASYSGALLILLAASSGSWPLVK